jgi:hypothetical protein
VPASLTRILIKTGRRFSNGSHDEQKISVMKSEGTFGSFLFGRARGHLAAPGILDAHEHDPDRRIVVSASIK